MASSLKVKLRTQALTFAGLTALLGGSDPDLFRWYDTQLVAGQDGGGWPAVVVRIVSNPNNYVFTGRLATGWARVQFTIWSTDPEVNESVLNQLKLFLAVFNGTGIPNLPVYPNQIANERDSLLPDEQPPQFQKVVDVQIFSNDQT